MQIQDLEKTFVDIAKQYDDCEDIVESLRSLLSCGEINEKQYDYLIKNFDNILQKYNV